MRSKQIAAVAAAALAFSLCSGGTAYAQKPGGGTGGQPAGPTWTTGESSVTQCLGADSCLATGAQSLSTTSTGATYGSVSSRVDLRRSTLYTGTDDLGHLSAVAMSFSLRNPTHVVTADVHFDKISVVSWVGAGSPEGHAIAAAGVGAEVVDSACQPRTCGATGQRVDSVVTSAEQLAGVDLRLVEINPNWWSPYRTVRVSLSMPDGSALPAGTITVFAYAYTTAWLSGLGCGASTQPLCDNGTPHTGYGTENISALVDGIDYTLS